MRFTPKVAGNSLLVTKILRNLDRVPIIVRGALLRLTFAYKGGVGVGQPRGSAEMASARFHQ